MTALGLPAPMFWVFVATIVAGSLGAVHFLIVHVALGRPVVETPPPALAREGDGGSAAGPGGAGRGARSRKGERGPPTRRGGAPE